MATPDDHWWDAQAGEYVLGTLRGTDRNVFERILVADKDTQERVQFWRSRLSALDTLIEPVQPPEDVLAAILGRIENEKTVLRSENTAENDRQLASSEIDQIDLFSATSATDFSADIDSSAAIEQTSIPDLTDINDSTVVRHKRSRASRKAIRKWKSIATLAIAATCALAAVLVHTVNQQFQPADASLAVVSVVQSDQQAALWVLTARSDSSDLQVVALDPPPLDDSQSYQLWMVKPNDTGVSSVGLLPQKKGEIRELVMQIATRDALLFAVSLEPAGGSPEPVPTGPILFTGSINTVDSSI